MNKKLNNVTNGRKAPIFKTRLDAVCYNQAKILAALRQMSEALKQVEGPLSKDECRFKLFISLADVKDLEFHKSKRFIIFVDPKDEKANRVDLSEAARYARKHVLGRIKIQNDFGHSIVITAYTAYRLDEHSKFLRFLECILIDELDEAKKILADEVGNTIDHFNADLGCINLFWTRK